MRKKFYYSLPVFLLLSFLVNEKSFAQTFAGSTNSTAGSNLIPSTGTGGCTVAPQTTGGTIFNVSIPALAPGSFLRSVNLNFTHTFDGDIDMYLVSPGGQIIELSTDNGGSGDNFTNTEFRDDAAINITAGTSPFTGQFKPEGSLTSNTCGVTITPTVTTLLAMGTATGTWQLVILDDAGGDTGIMIGWSLVFTTNVVTGPCAASAPTTFTNSTPVNIVDNTVVSSTITVSGAGPYLYDLNVITGITHTFNADLDITITSPAGTVVTLTSDNGGSNDDVFNGTIWDDNANPAGQVPYSTNNGMVTDHAYVNNVLASPLTPEEPLAAFIGENPNGIWTIRVSDDLGGDQGILNNWSLVVRSLPAAPTTATTSATNSTPVAIADNAVTTSTITVSGAGTQILDLNVFTNITHTFNADLDITITSPAGTVVTLTTDNGSSSDNVFAGTLWDDKADPGNQVPFSASTFAASRLVSDHLFTDLVTETPLAPEEPLGAFIGENPNGTWTITISDDLGGDVGTLNSWRLDLTTSTCVVACTLTCPANITTNAQPGVCGAVVNYPAPTTTGSCGTVTATPASGSVFPVGTTTVNVSTTSGSTCSFTITVVDNQPPTITCPSNITVNNNAGICGAVVNYPFPTVSDNCALTGGTAVPLTQSTNNSTIVPIQIGCQYFGGQTAENSWWRAYDLAPLNLPSGLTIKSVRMGIERITAATTVPVDVRIYTVSSGTFPAATLTLRASQTVNLPSQTNTFVTVPFTSPAAVPANAVVVVEVHVQDLLAANSAFFLGSNDLGQSAPSYISAAACGITTPTDITDVGFPDDHILLDLNGEYYTAPPTLVQIAGLPRGATFPVGTTVNTYRATDAAGNQSTCSFNVTVVDAEAPVFTTCPANVVRNTDAGVCYATYTPAQPVFTDNCAVTKLTWVMTGATTGSSPATGINYVPSTQFQLTGTTGQGITTITYTASDAAGNTKTCVQTITVNDASIPVISAQPLTKFVCVGSDAVFSVTASAGTGNPLTYQWQQWNGSAWVNISGATASSYTIPAVTFALNTNTYRVVLTGRCSVVISAVATLYINPLPTVKVSTSIPPSLIPSQSLTITATVSPTGGSFVWRKDGNVIAGATGSSLSGLTVDDIGTYRVTYTDPNGCVSTSADVVVTGQPYDKLWVYPNPNYGQFQVRFYNTPGENATVRVYDAKGAKVYERAVVTGLAYTQIDVDLGNVVPAGMYVVELVNGSGKRVGAKKIDVRHKP